MQVGFNSRIKPQAVTAALLVLLTAIYCAQNSAARVAFALPRAVILKFKLDPRIPPPDPSKYRHIEDASDWGNPFLIIGADEIQLTCKAAGINNKRIRPNDLAKTLASLPASAWPYGRVVAAEEAGVRGIGDSPRIKENVTNVAKTLESLGITTDWWPSA